MIRRKNEGKRNKYGNRQAVSRADGRQAVQAWLGINSSVSTQYFHWSEPAIFHLPSFQVPPTQLFTDPHPGQKETATCNTRIHVYRNMNSYQLLYNYCYELGESIIRKLWYVFG